MEDKKQKEDIQNQIQARLPNEQELALPLQIYQKDKALQHAGHHAFHKGHFLIEAER